MPAACDTLACGTPARRSAEHTGNILAAHPHTNSATSTIKLHLESHSSSPTMSLLHSLRQAARHQAARNAGATFGVQQLRCFAAPANQLQLIKELRERTGAPISDVKTALQAAGWDLGESSRQGRRAGCSV
jgi:hypothetical protein